MRIRLLISTALLIVTSACGNEIGDSCSVSRECDPNGGRFCDTTSPDGYCTIIGCDNDCPGGSVCIRFFSVGETNLPCERNNDCSADEWCTLGGYCVPRLAEVRYCMKTCGNSGDCRDDYECRDKDLMIEHGGEPVPEPNEEPKPDDELPQFCAPAPLPL